MADNSSMPHDRDSILVMGVLPNGGLLVGLLPNMAPIRFMDVMSTHNTHWQECLFALCSHHTCNIYIQTIGKEYRNLFITHVFVIRCIVSCCGYYKYKDLTTSVYGIPYLECKGHCVHWLFNPFPLHSFPMAIYEWTKSGYLLCQTCKTFIFLMTRTM